MLQSYKPIEEDNQTNNSNAIEQLVTIYGELENPPSSPSYILAGKSLFYFLAVNAGVPYIKPAFQYASNSITGLLYASSVYIALGSVSVWSVRNFFRYIHLIRKNSTSSRCAETTITLTSLALGIISSIPGAIITLKYDSLYFLPLSLFLDISSNTASYNEFFRKIYSDHIQYRKKKMICDHIEII